MSVGAASVFAIPYLSFMTSSFLGRVPYLLTARVMFSPVMLTGVFLAARMVRHGEPLPISLASLRATSLELFYLSSGQIASGIPNGLSDQ